MLDSAQSGPSNPSDSPSVPQLRRELRSWTRDLAVALGLALVIIIFLYQPVKVEGTSMAPLLSDQERIFINKFVYRFEPIDRGDVVVFGIRWIAPSHSSSASLDCPGKPSKFAPAICMWTGRNCRSPMCRRFISMEEATPRGGFRRMNFS